MKYEKWYFYNSRGVPFKIETRIKTHVLYIDISVKMLTRETIVNYRFKQNRLEYKEREP